MVTSCASVGGYILYVNLLYSSMRRSCTGFKDFFLLVKEIFYLLVFLDELIGGFVME